MRILLGCLILHFLLAGLIPSAWWVPDLTLVGLVLSVGSRPRRWWLLGAVAGFTLALWTFRNTAFLVMAYCLSAWLLKSLAWRWDASDTRIRLLSVIFLSFFLNVGLVWVEDFWSGAILAEVGIRILTTTLALWIISFSLQANKMTQV